VDSFRETQDGDSEKTSSDLPGESEALPPQGWRLPGELGEDYSSFEESASSHFSSSSDTPRMPAASSPSKQLHLYRAKAELIGQRKSQANVPELLRLRIAPNPMLETGIPGAVTSSLPSGAAATEAKEDSMPAPENAPFSCVSPTDPIPWRTVLRTDPVALTR